jgi:hypothetical protein
VLEGQEVSKEFDGGAGKLIVDVDDKGAVKMSAMYDKDLDGFAKVKSSLELESNIFMIAEKIAAKTGTTWDDKAIAGIKSLLGIV